MSDKVYKHIAVTACSSRSFEHAIELAVEKAAETLHGIAWFEVKEMRGAIKDGKPNEWQVTVKVAFKVD